MLPMSRSWPFNTGLAAQSQKIYVYKNVYKNYKNVHKNVGKNYVYIFYSSGVKEICVPRKSEYQT